MLQIHAMSAPCQDVGDREAILAIPLRSLADAALEARAAKVAEKASKLAERAAAAATVRAALDTRGKTAARPGPPFVE